MFIRSIGLIFNKIKKDNRGISGLLLVMLILTAVLSITLTSNEIMRHGVTFTWQQVHSTKAFFAAEGGIEQILYALRNRRVNFNACSDQQCIKFTGDGVATTTGTDNVDCGGACADADKFKTFSNGSEFYLKFSSSTSATTATNTVIAYGNYQGAINRAVAVRWVKRTCIGAACNAGAATSCLAIWDNGDAVDGEDGFYFINPLGTDSIEVWCDMTTSFSDPVDTDGAGWIELSPSGFPHGDGLYMCSKSAAEPATECGALPAWVYDSNTSVGYEWPGADTDACQQYFTWDYWSGPGNPLTSQEVYQISQVIASDGLVEKNFNIYNTSCDDDNRAATQGHWAGYRDYGGGSYNTVDCPSADMAYCDQIVNNAFDTWPFPIYVCCSNNDGVGSGNDSGGGVFMGFNRSNLKVR